MCITGRSENVCNPARPRQWAKLWQHFRLGCCYNWIVFFYSPIIWTFSEETVVIEQEVEGEDVCIDSKLNRNEDLVIKLIYSLHIYYTYYTYIQCFPILPISKVLYHKFLINPYDGLIQYAISHSLLYTGFIWDITQKRNFWDTSVVSNWGSSQ